MENHTLQNCRWAQPTLFLPMPSWFDAWHGLWTCRRDVCPRLLDPEEKCATCPRWEGRGQAGLDWIISQVGL